MSVSTSAVSVEYGRGQGAIINVITKSGTNRFEGSAKYIAINDEWDEQNSTKSETTGASLARVKFDKVNPVYTFTGGGPIVAGPRLVLRRLRVLDEHHPAAPDPGHRFPRTTSRPPRTTS